MVPIPFRTLAWIPFYHTFSPLQIVHTEGSWKFSSSLRSLPQLADVDISISACGENDIIVMVGNMNYLFMCDPMLTTM